MRIGLIDFDSKIPNLSLMKLSAFYKARGCKVTLNNFSPSQVDRVFCSVIFTRNRRSADLLRGVYGERISFGGTGYDVAARLPEEIESMRPDYDLYSQEFIYSRINRGIGKKETKLAKAQTLIDAGIGRLSTGCPRSCAFCCIPTKEPEFKRVGEVADILNPRSNVLVLLDNNLLALPESLNILRELRERKLTVDIAQGIDMRLMTDELARELASIRHLRSLHFAWDLMESEATVLSGLSVLTKRIKSWRLMCFVLTGFNTSFDEDEYRVRKLINKGVDPFVMVHDASSDVMLRHYQRYINARIYKACARFEDYLPWKSVMSQSGSGLLFEENA
jgi:hypothetical protein